MIKRNGVEIMNARSKNVSIAKETQQVIKDKKYTAPSGSVVDISTSLDAALSGTVYYPGDETAILTRDRAPIHSTIEVVNETTAQAAVRLQASGKTNIVALNFASARNQGGGFLAGAIAQEEDLCRASGLYACLKKKPMFYNTNIMCDDSYYTNGIIYSPNVPFFRDEHNLFLEKPFELSIISAPAPNVNGIKQLDQNKLIDILSQRIVKILDVAAFHGHKNIILGAWGCGAFGNDPNVVSSLLQAGVLLNPYFEHVTYAVYDTREPFVIYETFKKICK